MGAIPATLLLPELEERFRTLLPPPYTQLNAEGRFAARDSTGNRGIRGSVRAEEKVDACDCPSREAESEESSSGGDGTLVDEQRLQKHTTPSG